LRVENLDLDAHVAGHLDSTGVALDLEVVGHGRTLRDDAGLPTGRQVAGPVGDVAGDLLSGVADLVGEDELAEGLVVGLEPHPAGHQVPTLAARSVVTNSPGLPARTGYSPGSPITEWSSPRTSTWSSA